MELQAQKARSRNAAAVENDDWVELKPEAKDFDFVCYDTLQAEVIITKYRRVKTKGKTLYQLVFDRTPFYAACGGQAGDRGELICGTEHLAVIDTIKENNLPIHIVEQLPADPTADFVAVVDRPLRLGSARNHSATHLLHQALRTVLGNHVEQKGSQVTPEGLRFDFSHFQKMSDEELRRVEQLVNRAIRENYPLVENRNCTVDEAKSVGAMMLFGEKYGDKVRMVRFGESVELCGGTHVTATGCIGQFKIISESAISAGVRRIEAITGEAAERYVDLLVDSMREIQTIVRNPSVAQAVKAVVDENAELRHAVEQSRREKMLSLVESLSGEIGQMKSNNGVIVVARRIELPVEMIRDFAFRLKDSIPNLALVVGVAEGEKVNLAVALGSEVVVRGINAGETVRTASREIEGGGGGQPFFAMAGGKKPEGLDAAIAKAKSLIEDKLK